MERKYKKTLYASYIGYITQAIINNLAPLLFVTFQREYAISLEQIGFLVTFNFLLQIAIDLAAARYGSAIRKQWWQHISLRLRDLSGCPCSRNSSETATWEFWLLSHCMLWEEG